MLPFAGFPKLIKVERANLVVLLYPAEVVLKEFRTLSNFGTFCSKGAAVDKLFAASTFYEAKPGEVISVPAGLIPIVCYAAPMKKLRLWRHS